MNNKKYILSMFPYPSGNLHLGHVRVYTIADLYTRLNKLKQYDVINPMGWDAFGLPAENAAIERNIPPRKWTNENIKKMNSQFSFMDTEFDWDREVTTCNPDYYKWTQWIFLKLFERGLAYKADSDVLWDPIDQTVLANEQVDSTGKSWRSGATVETKSLNQWFFKITDFAEDLYSDLNLLDQWPESVKTMQENWIGKSTGTKISFLFPDNLDQSITSSSELSVFTTRPDTLFGVTYLAIAPNHPIIKRLSETDSKLRQFCTDSLRRAIKFPGSMEPFGYHLPSLSVLHPLTNESIPIYVADYVKLEYGTGAVMGVPAHDERDFSFAQKFGIPINRVLQSNDDILGNDLPLVHKSVSIVNSHPQLDSLSPKEAKPKIEEMLSAKSLGSASISFRIRDWLISRQRYWGTPIPVIICPECGPTPVPEKDLPVILPDMDSLSSHGGIGGSPLASDDPIAVEWRKASCPNCGNTQATRETDTMDTFVDSSWYFLRYCDPQNTKLPFDPKLANELMPVDMYIGGIEHAVLHLLYARFIHKFFVSIGMVDSQIREPFKMLLTQGLVTSKTYKVENTGKYVPESEIEHNIKGEPVHIASQSPVAVSVEKMSKSKYNGMDPIKVIEDHGVDTARLFLLFKAPPEKNLEWDLGAIQGQARWISRLKAAVENIITKENAMSPTTVLGSGDSKGTDSDFANLERRVANIVHSSIYRVERDLNKSFQINVAVAELMKLSNALSPSEFPPFFVATSRIYHSAWKSLIMMLYPFCPSLSTTLWQTLVSQSQWQNRIIYSFPNNVEVYSEKQKIIPEPQDWSLDSWDGGICDSPSQGVWPQTVSSLLSTVQTHQVIIQINGKTRGSIRIDPKELESLTQQIGHNAALNKLIENHPKLIKWTSTIHISKSITPPIHKDNAGIPRVLCNFVGKKINA